MDIPAKSRGEADIFAEALGVPVGERAAFLAKACGGDERLRRKVEALLKSHEQIGDFLEEAPDASVKEARVAAAAEEKPFDRIGRYKLLQQIGEGGCGVVFMAEQEEPVRRRVALKVIKPGMDTKSVIARFEAERQALALMDHPSIAKVFDAGATESGRPYFVMELVRGVKITEYCDEHSLTTEERLNLFIQVCAAIQHAHQKGIIHRDIKPSNILVTRTPEGTALPVVIDFGIAKPTMNQRLTDKTLFTAFEMFIGTPAYISPEQAALTSADVDTRTDIYSLGVLLYELLTGSKPFDTVELLKDGIDEVRRVIREQEPVRPSTRLSKLKSADLTTVAQRRKSEPPKLIRTICGDLDWIVMKALEKDRGRRYETANGFALDVKRFLDHEPVLARPPSKLYKFAKAAQRNKLLFFCIGIIAVLLVASLIAVTASLAKERQARREAQTEATKSQQVTKFLEEMLQGVGPSVARGRDTIIIEEILDRTAERVGAELTNQPAVEVQLRGLIGRVYFEIGTYDRAEKSHLAEIALSRKLFGEESESTAAALCNLGNAYWKQRKLAEAEAVYTESLKIRRRIKGEESAEVAEILNHLGNVFRRQRRLAESEELTRKGLAIRRKLFGNEHLDVADSLRNLSMVLVDGGELAEAELSARTMLAIRRRLLDNDHALVASALNDLAWVVSNNGKREEAEFLEAEAFSINRDYLGVKHPDVARSVYLFGERMRQRGNLTESHPILNVALSIQRELLGEDHPDVLATLRSLVLILEKEGKWTEAEFVNREAFKLWARRAGREAPQTLDELKSLVRILNFQKKFDEAEELLAATLTPEFLKNPSSADFVELRLDLLSRQERWKEAAAQAVLYLNLRPDDHERYHSLSPLLLVTLDHAAYEQLCREMLHRFGSTTNSYIADRVAKSCLLSPYSEVDLVRVDKLADMALSAGEEDICMPLFKMCKGLSMLRLGKFEKAIEWSEKSLNSSFVHAKAQAYAVLAIAHWRLGHKDEARAMLAKGNNLAPPAASADTLAQAENKWFPRLLARIQLDEASALIRTDAPPVNNGRIDK
jgi:eukaryotic-like serine/threonine-protein kinase